VRRLVALARPGRSDAPEQTVTDGAARAGRPAAQRAACCMRQGGEQARLARRHRQIRQRRLVLLLDVSGSMSPYADALLRFGHAAVCAGTRPGPRCSLSAPG